MFENTDWGLFFGVGLYVSLCGFAYFIVKIVEKRQNKPKSEEARG